MSTGDNANFLDDRSGDNLIVFFSVPMCHEEEAIPEHLHRSPLILGFYSVNKFQAFDIWHVPVPTCGLKGLCQVPYLLSIYAKFVNVISL